MKNKLWHSYRIAKVVDETWDTKTFFIKSEEGHFPVYKAGQFITFKFEVDGEKHARSYSLSSAPKDPYAAITVKRQPEGLISNILCDYVRSGDLLTGMKPLGEFVYNPSEGREHLFLLAGGSGVTPCYSIAREYSEMIGKDGGPKSITLVVSYKTAYDVIFERRLKELKEKGVNVEIYLTFDKAKGMKHGLVDGKELEQLCDGRYSNHTFYTCGPKGMMDAFVKFLKSKDVQEQHIKIENFG